MNSEWGSSAARTMTVSGLLLLLIVIRHVSAAYQGDYRSKWPTGVRSPNYQTIHQHSRPASHAHQPPHHHRHHHEYTPKSNRDVHIKSKHLQFLTERDYRIVTPNTKEVMTTTTRPVPRTTLGLSWKRSPSTAKTLRLPELTSKRYQGDNESSADSAVLNSEREDRWSSHYKQYYAGPYGMQLNSVAPTNPVIVSTNTNRISKSSWLHYNHPIQQYDGSHLRDEDKHPILLEKSSSLLDLDSMKIHPSQGQEAEDNFNFDDYMDDDPTVQNGNDDDKIESLTEEKWKNYGTAEAVEKSRRRYNNEGQAAAAAHIQRIKEESKCRWPHPKVIPVTEASKRFVPHCTILHRCGDDTGCCDYDTKTCTAKNTSLVHLHFFVIPLGGSASVEVRTFVNHTECHCIDRCQLSSCADRSSGGLSDNYGGATGNATCQCPTYFNIIAEEFTGGRCLCDCINNNQACQVLKRGQDSFPTDDQRCIADEKCQKPTCQYGTYSINSGRCPKHKHQKRTISRYDYR